MEECHKHGIIVILNLAHSAGCVPLHVHDWNVDAAAVCTYKHLSCGSGNSGFIYLNEKYATIVPALRGWWGIEIKSMLVMS